FFPRIRRHNKSKRDLSSGVCSSDLADHQEHGGAVSDTATGKQVGRKAHRRRAGKTNKLALREIEGQLCLDFGQVFGYWHIGHFEIGRASCREGIKHLLELRMLDRAN